MPVAATPPEESTNRSDRVARVLWLGYPALSEAVSARIGMLRALNASVSLGRAQKAATGAQKTQERPMTELINKHIKGVCECRRRENLDGGKRSRRRSL
jgi:hypothetical protein